MIFGQHGEPIVGIQRGDGPSSHQGIAPSQYGIQASGWFNDALDVIKTLSVRRPARSAPLWEPLRASEHAP